MVKGSAWRLGSSTCRRRLPEVSRVSGIGFRVEDTEKQK